MSIKTLLKKLYPKPRGIRAIGSGSAILFPRKVVGADGLSLGDNVIIQPHGWIACFKSWGDQRFSPSIQIGSGTRIGKNVMITAVSRIEIGSDCLFSEQTFVSDHAHGAELTGLPPTLQPLHSKGSVVIGNRCFIGIRACILSGVTLGDNCVVGANSVVTSSFSAGSVIAGVSARLIKTLS